MSEAAKNITEAQGQIVEDNEFEGKLAEFKKKYVGVVYDLDDEDQMKQAKADRLEIGRVVSRLDKIHDDIKAPLKERVDLIDGERKRIKDQLLDVQDGIKDQIKAHEQKKAEHEARKKRCGGPPGCGTVKNPNLPDELPVAFINSILKDPNSPRWCIASDCMMWRETAKDYNGHNTGEWGKGGYCGLGGKP